MRTDWGYVSQQMLYKIHFFKNHIWPETSSLFIFSIRPDQSVKYHNIKWRRRVLSSAKEKPIKIDHEHFVLLPDKTLQINHITREDGGIYYCYQGKGHAATYMVDVLRGERYDTVFNPPDRGKRPAGPKDLEQYNIKIISNWSPWSKCNRCNKRGQHRRIGFCSVKKLDQDKPIKPEHIHWFDQFKDGLPCRSSLLPLSVKGLKEIKYRKSEILMGYCFKPCPTLPPIKTYTDAKGKVRFLSNFHVFWHLFNSNGCLWSSREGIVIDSEMKRLKPYFSCTSRQESSMIDRIILSNTNWPQWNPAAYAAVITSRVKYTTLLLKKVVILLLAPHR